MVSRRAAYRWFLGVSLAALVFGLYSFGRLYLEGLRINDTATYPDTFNETPTDGREAIALWIEDVKWTWRTGRAAQEYRKKWERMPMVIAQLLPPPRYNNHAIRPPTFMFKTYFNIERLARNGEPMAMLLSEELRRRDAFVSAHEEEDLVVIIAILKGIADLNGINVGL